MSRIDPTHDTEQQCIEWLTEHYGTSRSVNTMRGQSHIFGCLLRGLGRELRDSLLIPIIEWLDRRLTKDRAS